MIISATLNFQDFFSNFLQCLQVLSPMASNHSIAHILKPGSTTAASAASLPAAAAVNLPALQPIYPLRFTPPLRFTLPLRFTSPLRFTPSLYQQQPQLIQPQVLQLMPPPPPLVPMPQPPPLIPVGTGDEGSTGHMDQKKDQKKKRKRKHIQDEKLEEQLNGNKKFFL